LKTKLAVSLMGMSVELPADKYPHLCSLVDSNEAARSSLSENDSPIFRAVCRVLNETLAKCQEMITRSEVLQRAKSGLKELVKDFGEKLGLSVDALCECAIIVMGRVASYSWIPVGKAAA
jgi:hypothetical protein